MVVGNPAEMDRAEFLVHFGGVFENSQWVAERAFDAGIADADVNGAAKLHAKIAAVFAAASDAERLLCLTSHDDLLATSKKLSSASVDEHKGVGLGAGLTDEERARMAALIEAHTAKFGFPFIIALKGLTKPYIL
jgi:urate oxidase